MGLGSIALGSLLGRDSARANGVKPFLPGKPHFTPKAKNVIYLFMGGGPSQLELYDWKPELAKRHGGDIPDEFVKGKRFAFMNSTFKQNNKLLLPLLCSCQQGPDQTFCPAKSLWLLVAVCHLHHRPRVDPVGHQRRVSLRGR